MTQIKIEAKARLMASTVTAGTGDAKQGPGSF
jgi:hypothetical protein